MLVPGCRELNVPALTKKAALVPFLKVAEPVTVCPGTRLVDDITGALIVIVPTGGGGGGGGGGGITTEGLFVTVFEGKNDDPAEFVEKT